MFGPADTTEMGDRLDAARQFDGRKGLQRMVEDHVVVVEGIEMIVYVA